MPIFSLTNVAIEPLTEFLNALSNCSISYVTNVALVTNSEFERIKVLPLPVKEVPESIRKATLLGYKKAAHSHRLFNTPQDAEYQNKRSFWQQTASFFGARSFGGQSRDMARETPCSEVLYQIA